MTTHDKSSEGKNAASWGLSRPPPRLETQANNIAGKGQRQGCSLALPWAPKGSGARGVNVPAWAVEGLNASCLQSTEGEPGGLEVSRPGASAKPAHSWRELGRSCSIFLVYHTALGGPRQRVRCQGAHFNHLFFGHCDSRRRAFPALIQSPAQAQSLIKSQQQQNAAGINFAPESSPIPGGFLQLETAWLLLASPLNHSWVVSYNWACPPRAHPRPAALQDFLRCCC